MAHDDAKLDDGPEDWAHRQLCADGGCIGVIGPDGVCSECGAPGPEGELDPRLRGLGASAEADRAVERHRVAHSTPEAPEDWDERQLCPDGACIGLIGADGHCADCGKQAE